MMEHAFACLGAMCGGRVSAEITADMEIQQLEDAGWPGSAGVWRKPSAFPGLEFKAG